MNGLSKYYIRKIINCFSAEMTATATSQKLKINRNTVNKYYRIIREAVSDYQESLSRYPSSVQKEAHFLNWHRYKGLCMDYTISTSLFKLVEREGKVFISQADERDLPEKYRTKSSTKGGKELDMPIAGNAASLEGNTQAQAQPKLDQEDAYRNASPTVKSFFNYAREKLAKFYGVKPEYTYLYLKELEFRFNNKGKDLGKIIWRILPHHSSHHKKFH